MRKPITLLRNGDVIYLGYADATRCYRVTGLREKTNGTGYILSVVDEHGNRTEHGFMPLDPNRHLFEVVDRPNPQRWDGTKGEFYTETDLTPPGA